MTDMLVKLYDLPPLLNVDSESLCLRRGLAPEKHIVLDWIEREFEIGYRSEGDVAFARQPVSCFIVTEGNQVIGFACYDAIARGFFGPTGVRDDRRGRGLGKALLLACLHDMFQQGYAYAIIGDIGPAEFYERVVGAVRIAGSTPGIYRGLLRE